MEQELVKQIYAGIERINQRWLRLQYQTAVALVVAAMVIEGVYCIFIAGTELLATSRPLFYLKYWVIPCAANLLCILLQTAILRSKRTTQKLKIYAVSLGFVVLCFVLVAAHNLFSALYFIYAIPIVLTIVYADYWLTSWTAALCIVTRIAAELSVVWNPVRMSVIDESVWLLNLFIGTSNLIAFCGVCMVVIVFERKKNADILLKEIERAQLLKQLQTDELTGVYNRSALNEAIAEMERHEKQAYIFVMLDVDNFKYINDTYGHLAGDRYLAAVGEILRRNCREAAPFRYGGDEFSIIFKGVRLKTVLRICTQIQRDLAEVAVKEQAVLTTSIGIAARKEGMTIPALVAQADKALYQAKAVRNTTRVS